MIFGGQAEQKGRPGRPRPNSKTSGPRGQILTQWRTKLEEEEEDEDEIVPESMSRSGAKSKNLTRSKELTESTPSKSKPPKAARPDPNSFEKLGEGDEEEEFLVTKSRAGTKTKV